ncbi:MAG: mechanosensitive ion channel family protein [Acidobacteria bacterium]|nr:mechanosensitive ion channel family protein [Acidobacteriota bacterium]
MDTFWEETIFQPLQELGRQAVASLSSLLGMVILIFLGLGVGWLAKELVCRALRLLRFDRLCDTLGVSQEIERLGIVRPCSYVAGQVVQGMIILTALLAGLNAMRSPWTQNLVERFFVYVPHLLAALVILVVGALVSRFLGRSVLIAAVNARMPSARLLSALARIFVMTLAVVATLDELGIGRTTIIVTFAILFGGLVTAGAIAFGLGARDLARDLLNSQFRPGPKPEVEDTLRHL